MSTWRDYLSRRRGQSVDDLLALLRFASLSADPDRGGEMRACAEWVGERLRRAGASDVRLLDPRSHPTVFGQWSGAGPNAPTVLIYGHYDVQPADPLEQWTWPPFEPTIADGRVWARGASDMKGNLLLPIIALEALIASGERPSANLKFLFEGQEEIGSRDLPDVLREHRRLLACDLVVSADSGQLGEAEPAIWLSTRGMCALQVDVRGPARDVHSGLYGGAIQNPLHALAEIVSSLHARSGAVAVDGFYDDVAPIAEWDRRSSGREPITDEHVKTMIGVPDVFGEAGYSTYERTVARPTVEVNGLWGGYMGEGTKTVIPSEAHAKITCRLVSDQDPDRVLESIERHILKRTPRGVVATVSRLGGSARAYSVPASHPGNAVVASVLSELYGSQPVPMRIGGSVPIYDVLKQELGTTCVMMGFGLEDEAIHAPNESYRLASFERGQAAYCMLFERLGRFAPAEGSA